MSETGQPYSYANDDPVNESDATGLAFFSQCASLAEGGPQTSCDIGALYAQEYGPIDKAGVVSLVAAGAAGGAAIGGALGGGVATPVTAAVGAAIGATSLAIFGFLEGDKAANSYLTSSYVEGSAQAALNIIYIDNTSTEPSGSDLKAEGGLKAYEWADLAQTPVFGWFTNQVEKKLIGNDLANVFLEFIKQQAKKFGSAYGVATIAYRQQPCGST